MNEDETLDDLQIKGFKILQKVKGFRFGMDAVLLANFAKTYKYENVIDLCSGCGIIPFIVAAKKEFNNLLGLEIQDDLVEMANRSSKLNNLEGKLKFLKCDIKDLEFLKTIPKADVVTVNPPYKISKSGILNMDNNDRISRHEILCTLEDVILASSILLKDNGRLYMVNRSDRICDCVCEMRKMRIEPKVIRFVQSKIAKAPHLFLIEGRKYGGRFLKVLSNLIIYDENQNYTDEIMNIYK